MRRLVLAKGGLFLLADTSLNLRGLQYGLYRDDTRHLSQLRVSIDHRPLKLSSTVAPSGCEAIVSLMDQQGQLLLKREALLYSHYQERISLCNVSDDPMDTVLRISWSADFRDVFEVRGLVPRRRRSVHSLVGPGGITWIHKGGDGVPRWTSISARPRAGALDRAGGVWHFALQPGRWKSVTLRVDLGRGRPAPSQPTPHPRMRRELRARRRALGEGWAVPKVDGPQLRTLFLRSLQDIEDLLLVVNGSRIPVAGAPWFSAPFGRDSLILGLQTLHLNSRLSADILRVLASLQGHQVDNRRAEAPGKVMHELRRGELAGMGAIPHTPYYGSVDSTPLFLCLLGEYYAWTGDSVLCQEIYTQAMAAARHISAAMEAGPAGFLGYERHAPPGLRHQGWKDSDTGILFPDGSQPGSPIALCEVQGYVYWGFQGLARIARDLGHRETAGRLTRQADDLRRRFHPAFWIPRDGYYALAIDGEGERVETVTSNPGHLLMCGILPPERSEKLARRLMQEDLFSGWGLRTMSRAEKLYDPTSYHNGSVWPHDTSLAAWGMSRCGLHDLATILFRALTDAASSFPHLRLPELFAGFGREEKPRPVGVSGACEIQAWSAGAPLLMLRGLLGLEADAPTRRLRLSGRPPDCLQGLVIKGMRVGGTAVDISFRDELEVRTSEGPYLELLVV